MSIPPEKIVVTKTDLSRKDFIYSSAYLLFSKIRNKEEYHSDRIKKTLDQIDLQPKQLLIEDRVMFVKCDGLIPLNMWNKILEDITSESIIAMGKSLFYFPVVGINTEMLDRKPSDYKYNFK